MGLLDALQSPEAQLGLGLLSAAGPSAVPMSFGQRLGGAMQQFQAAKIAEEERRQKAAMQALQAQLINAQIGETQAQAKQREAEAAKLQQAALRAQQFQSDLSKAGTVSPSAALAGGGGPTQANAANIGASRPIDWQALAIQYPDQIKAIEELSKARNFGRDKVARTVKGLGPDGREYEYQVDDYGNKVGAGMAQYRAPIEIGQGDRKTFADAYNLNPLGSFAINQSPDSKASNAVAWANNAIARDRLGWEKQQADKPQYDAERGILVNPRSGQAQEVQMGGKPIGPKDKNLPVDFTKSVGGLKELANGIESYKSALASNGGVNPLATGTSRAALKSSFTALQMGLKNAFELGALAGPDLSLLQGMLVDPTSPQALIMGDKGVAEQLNKAKEYIRNRGRAVYEAHGKPVPQEYAVPVKNITVEW